MPKTEHNPEGDKVRELQREKLWVCTKQSFVFPGCRIRKKRGILRNLRSYSTHRWLLPKARKRLRDRVRELTDSQSTGVDVKQMIAKLNPVLRGWANDFRSGSASRELVQLDRFVYPRLVRWRTPRPRGAVRYPAQAAPARSSLSRMRANRTHGLKGVC
jgi:RNA-directed DNA polymerase